MAASSILLLAVMLCLALPSLVLGQGFSIRVPGIFEYGDTPNYYNSYQQPYGYNNGYGNNGYGNNGYGYNGYGNNGYGNNGYGNNGYGYGGYGNNGYGYGK